MKGLKNTYKKKRGSHKKKGGSFRKLTLGGRRRRASRARSRRRSPRRRSPRRRSPRRRRRGGAGGMQGSESKMVEGLNNIQNGG